MLTVLGIGVIGGGFVGALGVGGVMLVLTVVDSLAVGATVDTALVFAFLAALIGAVLGAASGLCAVALAWAAGRIARRAPKRLPQIVGAAVGGGVSTSLLIALAQLLPDVPVIIPAGLSLLAAGLDAAVAVVLTRTARL